MQAEILPFKVKKFEDVLDSSGKALPGWSRHKKTGNIYYRKTFKKMGIPTLHASTGEKTLGRAKAKIIKLTQTHVNEHLGIDDSHVFKMRDKSGPEFQSVANEVLTRVTPVDRREKTQKNHRHYIPKLIEVFGSYRLDAISVKRFETWVEEKRKETGRISFMDEAKAMNLIMRYAYNQKLCTHLIKFKNPDVKKQVRIRVYTDNEIQRLWDAMGDNTRDQFVLSYECMMRLREMLYLTWERVNLVTGVITLRAIDVKTGAKTGRGREFEMSEHALERMRARFKKMGHKSLFVFPSRNDRTKPADQNKSAWSTAKSTSKIKRKATWHDLRHTAITKALLEAKMTPIEVSEYAGVSIATIQSVYLHSKAEHTRSVKNAVSILRKGVNAVRTAESE